MKIRNEKDLTNLYNHGKYDFDSKFKIKESGEIMSLAELLFYYDNQKLNLEVLS